MPEPPARNARQWLEAFAERLGVEPPSTEQFKTLLDLAGEAAHASERVAAPLACWLVGRAGVDAEEAVRLAQEVSRDG